MLTKPLLSHILKNDALTRGLGDAEARMLVEWLVEQAETSAKLAASESALNQKILLLCRRGRAIGRFLVLWCQGQMRGAAGQLAVAEGFSWPLPQPQDEPYEILEMILHWEEHQLHSGETAESRKSSYTCEDDEATGW